jgi:hypothetical protein
LPFAETFALSERLAEAEVYLAVLQAVDGRAAAELRDDELGRVEQVGPVNADGAERRLEPQPEPDGVRPLLARVRVAPRLARLPRWKRSRTLSKTLPPS